MKSPKENEIWVYSNGIVCCSVCSPFDVEETTERLNLKNPTGVGNWSLSEEDFRDGVSNPCSCPDDDNRKHYLFNC